jgi:hypothetical protein
LGTKVLLETIIGEEDPGRLVHEVLSTLRLRTKRRTRMQEVIVPSEATRSGVSGDVYAAWRTGLTTSCADVVSVIAGEPGEEPMVPLIRRANPPFKDCWWIMGGAVFNGRSLDEFLLWKLLGEGGVFKGSIAGFANMASLNPENPTFEGVSMVGYMGTYRTIAEDTEGTDRSPCDTINVCYMALLPSYWKDMLGHDKDHTALRFATEADLVPKYSCGHWYPRRVALRALQAYKVAGESMRDRA